MPILSVRDLRVRYTASGPEILKGISFDVEEDDFFAIIGPSGAGKSTLIRCINRLVTPLDGEIVLYGTDVLSLNSRQLRRLRRGIGMIFQEFNLVNRMSVMDNVLSGRLGYMGNFAGQAALFFLLACVLGLFQLSDHVIVLRCHAHELVGLDVVEELLLARIAAGKPKERRLDLVLHVLAERCAVNERILRNGR